MDGGEGMLRLTVTSTRHVLKWAMDHPLVEVTGMVVEDASGAQRVQPMQNVAGDPTKYYAWDTTEMRQVFRRMDSLQERPVAIYHSHPGGKSDPSEADMQGALMQGMYYLIAYPDSTLPVPEVVWRLSTWECIEPGILLESGYEVGLR